MCFLKTCGKENVVQQWIHKLGKIMKTQLKKNKNKSMINKNGILKLIFHKFQE